MLQINSNNPDLYAVGLDITGDPLYHYQGQPFTGMMMVYKKGILVGEYEFQDGYTWGVQRDYYSNGNIKYEHHVGPGGLHGRFRKWDVNGNIEFDSVWANGVDQH